MAALADEVLALAEHSAADAGVVSCGACVWAHQAAEMALNALLILRGIVNDEGSAFTTIELPKLTRCAIEGRCPADFDEATPVLTTQAPSPPSGRARPRLGQVGESGLRVGGIRR